MPKKHQKQKSNFRLIELCALYGEKTAETDRQAHVSKERIEENKEGQSTKTAPEKNTDNQLLK